MIRPGLAFHAKPVLPGKAQAGIWMPLERAVLWGRFSAGVGLENELEGICSEVGDDGVERIGL